MTGVWNLMTAQHSVSVCSLLPQAHAVGPFPPGDTTLPVDSVKSLPMVAVEAMIIVSVSRRNVIMSAVSGIMECLLCGYA